MNLNNWLIEHNLEKYAGLLQANDIDDLQVLASLTEADLESIGIPLGGRRKFASALNPNQNVAAAPAPDGAEVPAEEQVAVPQINVPTIQQEQPVSHAAVPPPTQQVQQPAPDTVVHAQQQAQTWAVPPVAPKAKPKSSSGSKATAIIIAIAAHVGILLVATLLVILPPLKDDPEIVAYAVTQSEKKQEMKKKTVQKQVKRSPSSASAAAAPMALMMKANAVAEFSLPDVKTTSTGPLGVGDGELGNGGFGAGTGLGSGDGQGGAAFMGTTTKGELAVIFDITASMYNAVPEVVKEIRRSFKSSQVLVMFSGGFANKPRTQLVPYKSNQLLQKYVEVNCSGNPDKQKDSERMNRSLFRLERCDSLIPHHKSPTKQTIYNNFQSLGVGIETLVNQDKPPGTIFVFSDFLDTHDANFMVKISNLCVQKKVKVVFWNPLSDDAAVPAPYRAFARKVGGEVKIEEL